MTDEPTNGQKFTAVMNGAWTTTLARFMQLVGIPALMVISYWMFMTVNDINSRVVRIEETIKQRIAWSDERIGAINQRQNDIELRLRILEAERRQKP